MKKSAFIAFAGFVIILLASTMVSGRDIALQMGKETQTRVVSNTYEELLITQTIAEINTLKIRTEEGVFIQLNIPGFSYSQETGAPRLPVNRRLIEVPAGAQPVATVTWSGITTIDLLAEGLDFPVMPVQPPAVKDGTVPEFVINRAKYTRDEMYGQEPVNVEVLGYMRGVRIARVDIAPVKYNPVRNILEIYEDMQVHISFEGADVARTMEEKRMNEVPYFRSLSRQILNNKPLPPANRDTITKYPVKFVIVSDPMFEAQLQPLVEWKTRKGFTVIEAYTNDPGVGNTTASIKAYLQGLYDAGTPEDPAPSFVLFVGDVQQIPAWNGTAGGHVTDLFYCEYTGDYFPEIYYGRFSAQNAADLQPQIDKTLQYEQYTMPDPSYLNEVVMVAGMDSGHGYDWGNGQINYGTENYFNAAHGLTSHTYLYPESGSHSADIIQNVSDGVSYGNYTAHCSQSGWGDPSFTTGDIPGLQNQDEYCLLVGNCCLSSAYDANECFAEAIVRAENKGAVGYIGGSNSTYWDPDYYWGVGVGPITQDPPSYEETTLGAYDRTFHDHMEPFEDWYTTQDQMIFAGNLAVTQGDPGSAQYYWEIYCLMGDPSLMIYYSVPPVITVSYDPLMPLGATSFTVNTEPYAYVAISMDNVLYGATLADAAGTAIVALNPIQQPGTADVVVTKQNGQPYIGTVVVNNPAGPFVTLDEYTVKDPDGNGNGQADYGESIVLDVQLENLGMSDAENVSAVLSSDDTFVTITDDQQDYGTIAAQSTSMQVDAFAFDISDAIPDQHPLAFELIMQDNAKETWNSSFTILVNAPDLVAAAVIVDDVANGNGNGRLDPGEEADIVITVGNEGHSDALNAIASLSTASSWITLVNNTVSFDTLFYGEEGSAVFTVTVDEDSPAGTSAAFSFDLTAGNYGCEKEFFLVIGQIPVLVIDFDGNHNSAPAMMTCFDNLEVGAELVSSMPADLNLYASVFVCLGVYSENHVLSANEGQTLFDYLENGGRLYMEGGDTWYYDDLTAVHPLFGIQGTEDGDGDLGTILGQDGTFTAEMTFAYSGDNNWIDHLAPISPAFVIFENVSPQYNCAIANDVEQNYKTIGSSFEFGGLDDGTTTKDELMIQYLEFFGIQGIWTSMGDEKAMANDIQLYPNPASDQIYIGLNRSDPSELSVILTNSFGQEVMTILEKQTVEEKIRFSADVSGLAAGVYYCIIRLDNSQEVRKLIITK